MNLKIRNVSGAYIAAADQTHNLDVNIEGVLPENLLNNIDILAAIEYYGITELLDTIGEDQIKSHLKLNKQ